MPTSAAPRALPIFRSPEQAKILSRLYLNSERPWEFSELAGIWMGRMLSVTQGSERIPGQWTQAGWILFGAWGGLLWIGVTFMGIGPACLWIDPRKTKELPIRNPRKSRKR